MTEVFESVPSFVSALKRAASGGEKPRIKVEARMITGPCGLREYVVYKARAKFNKGNDLRLEVCCGELKGEAENDRVTARVAGSAHKEVLDACAEIGAVIPELKPAGEPIGV